MRLGELEVAVAKLNELKNLRYRVFVHNSDLARRRDQIDSGRFLPEEVKGLKDEVNLLEQKIAEINKEIALMENTKVIVTSGAQSIPPGYRTEVSKNTAYWFVNLLCDCPHCGVVDVDLLEYGDFWEGKSFEIGEIHTKRTVDVKVICPRCGESFLCDFEF